MANRQRRRQPHDAKEDTRDVELHALWQAERRHETPAVLLAVGVQTSLRIEAFVIEEVQHRVRERPVRDRNEFGRVCLSGMLLRVEHGIQRHPQGARVPLGGNIEALDRRRHRCCAPLPES